MSQLANLVESGKYATMHLSITECRANYGT